MRTRKGVRALVALVVAMVTNALPAQKQPGFFRDVLPILQARCTGCHQPAKCKDGLLLTSFEGVMAGKRDKHDAADDEPVVVPGDPSSSLLLEVVQSQGGKPPAMPDKGEPMTASEVEVLRAWIAAGAIDDTPASAKSLVRPDHPPTYHTLPVITCLAWSQDGTLLAVPGRNEVLLHRMSDSSGAPAPGAPVPATTAENADSVTPGSVTPRSVTPRSVTAAGATAEDAMSHAAAARLVGLAERIESVAFSPDGTRLAVVGGSPARFGELQVWSLADHALAMSRVVTHDCLFGVSWSPDSRLVAFGATDKAVRALEADGGAQVLFQGAHDDWVLDTTFSTDGSHLVTVGRDRSMKLTKVESQQFIDNITSVTPGALKGGLMSVERHPTKDELLVGGADGTPRIYKMYREKKRVIGDDFNLIRAFDAMPGRVFSVAWVGDGARIVAGASHATGGEVRMHKADDGALLWRHETSAGIYAVAPSPDGRQVAIAGFEGIVEILDGETGTVTGRFVPVPLEAAVPVDASAENQRNTTDGSR